MDKINIENTQLIEIDKLKQNEEPAPKRKLPWRAFVFFVLFVGCIFYFQTQTIVVKNNASYSDQEVINLTNIKPEKSMLLQFQTTANIRVRDNALIEEVTLEKNYLDKEIIINVVEKQYLGLIKDGENEYLILADGTVQKIKNDEYYDAPIIYPAGLSEENIQVLIEQLGMLDPGVIGYISEISYEKTETDVVLKLKMTDTNTVYINLNELAYKLNFYPELKMSTNGKFGVFHLDNGNYFKPY